MDTIKALQILVTVLAIACVIAGGAIFAGYLDAAALIEVPATFNKPCAIILIVTGALVLAVPYLPKPRDK